MSAIISIRDNGSKDRYIVEIDAGKGNWIPKDGEQFFVPNLISMTTPVVDFDWKSSPSDFRLASMRMVHKTFQEALEHYHAQVQLQCMVVL